MAGYVRQQFYVDEDIILADHTNDEYDQLVSAFSETAGHKHDGTAGEGAAIKVMMDADQDTKVLLDETADNDEISFITGGAKRVYIDNTGLVIGGRYLISYNATNDTLDIGVI